MTEENRPDPETALPSEPAQDAVEQDRSPSATNDPGADPAGGGPDSFPIVGLGASAGGLEALTRFFSHVPLQTGIAFVVVTHQHPGHTSLMPELLSRHTSMPVRVAKSGTRVEPDCVYVAPPGVNLAILKQTLHEMEPEQEAPRLPIDYFFRSLAQDQRERAIGIILSGTGSDGTLGLKEIKGASGMVMVQDETAEYAGMPHSAIATELVDYVLPVDEMPRQLVAYAGSPCISASLREGEELSETIQQIFVLLRDHTGHDFSNYKMSTITRRIGRRLNVHQIDSAQNYARYLQTHEGELDILFKELLIGVTSFFRDPDAFEALGHALLELLGSLSGDHVIRVWAVGCSTGEEAYSLAILLHECMDRLGQRWNVQIFATDLDSGAIDVARAGVYPDGIAVDVSPERLERFFQRADGGYRAKKEIREMLVFAPQNLISDPPFTKLDLLSCRNLLIYLDGTLQSRLLPIFHYALRPAGLLFLGSSESIGSFGHLFETVAKRSKVFRRREVPVGSYQAEFPAMVTMARRPRGSGSRHSEVGARADSTRLAERLMLHKLVPPTVLVHERGDVVHIHGRTGPYLEPAPGPGPQARVNIFNMAREGLQIHLAAAIRQAANRAGEVVVRRGVRVKLNGGRALVDLKVQQLSQPEPLRGLFLVSFEQPALADPEAGREEGEPMGHLVELERELQHTREGHQGTIEELETTNEELQSANEELQSANEELETSKEELQSANEELHTVNAELQGKVEELSDATDDMRNLLNGTKIATVFLDADLKIKRFTEQAKQVIRIVSSDVGRSIGDLVTRFHYGQLEEDAREVLRTLAPKEFEVRGEQGWYMLRILPYRTAENMISGLVITFVEVSRLKSLEEREGRVQYALRGSGTSVCGQDRELRYTWVCSSGLLGLPPESIVGKTDADLLPEAEAAALGVLKQEVLETGIPARRVVELLVAGAPRAVGVHVTAVSDAEKITGIACVYTDVATSGDEA
jgi:two-component system CheB/CheR fusion protein